MEDNNIPQFPEEKPEALRNIQARTRKYDLPPDESLILKGESDQVADENVITSPLDEKVIDRQRDIAPPAPSIDTATPITEPIIRPQAQVTQPINVPTNKEIRADQNQQWEKGKEYAVNKLGEKESGSAPVNSAVTTMSTKEEKERLKFTVDTAIYIYAKIKTMIGDFFVISPQKMRVMERTKKVKLDWAVDIDQSSGKPYLFRDMIIDINKRILKAVETSEEFKNKVRPLLEAEFMKRGWVLSYQQNLMFIIGQDLYETGQKLWNVQRNMDEAIKTIQTEVKAFEVDGGLTARQMYNIQQHQVYVPFSPGVASPQNHPVNDPAIDPDIKNTPETPVKSAPVPPVTEKSAEKSEVTFPEPPEE